MKVLEFIFINPTELEYLQSKFIASTRFIASESLWDLLTLLFLRYGMNYNNFLINHLFFY